MHSSIPSPGKGYSQPVCELLPGALHSNACDIVGWGVVGEAHRTKNLGRLLAPDACAILQARGGDAVEIYLMPEKNTIRVITLMTDGCGPGVA
jgi:hypothetical protein